AGAPSPGERRFFSAQTGWRAAPGLTKFQKFNGMMLPRLNGVLPQSGLFGHRNTETALGTRRRSTLGNPPTLKETLMKKTLVALAAAATVATAIAATPTPADARCFGCAVGAGVLGGFVAGAIVGNAVANSQPAYVAAPGPGYVVYPAYAAPLPGPGCYWTRMPVYDMYGNVVGWRGRPVAVCQ